MGACLASLACSCCASATCTACCAACSCKCMVPPRIANWFYIGFLIVGACSALYMRYSENDLNVSALVGAGPDSACDATKEDCGSFVFDICNAASSGCKARRAAHNNPSSPRAAAPSAHDPVPTRCHPMRALPNRRVLRSRAGLDLRATGASTASPSCSPPSTSS